MLQRVVNIKIADQTATAFIIHKNNIPFLITARHIFNGLGNGENIDVEIRHANSRWEPLSCRLYLHVNQNVDIAILAPVQYHSENGVDDTDILTSNNLILGQDAFFLGFPYCFAQEVGYAINKDFPLPLVKKAVISSMPNPSVNANFFLDGNNNLGFSGGPVCFFDKAGNKFKIAGVISGFVSDKIEMTSVLGWKSCIPINTGIIIASDIYFANEILEKIIG